MQPLLSVLTQPLTDLGAVHAVKEAAKEAPEAVLELWRSSQQLRWMPDLMHAFQHQVRDGARGPGLSAAAAAAVAAFHHQLPGSLEIIIEFP